MRGIVFSLKNREHRAYGFSRLRDFSLKRFMSLYSVRAFFFLMFFVGVIFGASSFDPSSTELLSQLDFLFVTNLSNRLSLSAFDVFCSSFASDFLFVFSCFLLSFTAWGMFALPALCAFKGYGLGITAAYLISEHSLSGLGFFVLVILPGAVLFFMAFIVSLNEAFTHSVDLLKLYFSSKTDVLLHRNIKTFFVRFFIVLIFAVFSAIVDMILWSLFANMFNF